MTTITDLVAARRADVAADERRRAAALNAEACARNHAEFARRAAQEAIDAQHTTTRHFGRVARALADMGTVVERVDAAAAREELQHTDLLSYDIGAALGLSEDDMDEDAHRVDLHTHCERLAQALVRRAELKATADRAEAARESADDVRDWQVSR